MSENARPIVIRRRRKVIVHGHGGSWKIALADFMTALMALILVDSLQRHPPGIEKCGGVFSHAAVGGAGGR